MVNVFGGSIGAEGLENLQVLRKMIGISGWYADYINEIQASHKLGDRANRIASEGSPTFVFTYANKVFLLGSSSSISGRANFNSYNENSLPRILERR